MALLVINTGSSSIKVSVFDGQNRADFNLSTINDLKNAVKGYSIQAVAHRVVHGGSLYTAPVKIDAMVLANLDKLSELAPLHNPRCIDAIRATVKLLPDMPQYAVFDTAFFANMPAVAATVGIPHQLAEEYSIRRYGFHGIAHAFVSKALESSKLITLHLGSGCSAVAIQNGTPLDTSMGFTPLEGLLMATRSGDIDAGVVEFLCRHGKKSIGEVVEMLNRESGLLGVSGVSSDLREILERMDTDPHAQLAFELFCYRIVKYVGAYAAVLQGVDVIAFSGGIGENSPVVRERILQALHWLGVHVSDKANASAVAMEHGAVACISTEASMVKVFVVAVDENREIADSVKIYFD